MRAREKSKTEDTAVKQWAADGHVNSSVHKSNSAQLKLHSVEGPLSPQHQAVHNHPEAALIT